MLTGSEQATDPHFQARGYPRWVDQQELGRMAFEGECFKATGMFRTIVTQVPKVGEHTREIGRHLLGLRDDDLAALIESGVLQVSED